MSATGNAVAAEDLTLNFQSGGTLTEVDVTAGQTVTQGQVLAKIDSTTAENQLQDRAGEPLERARRACRVCCTR